ncbi:MAG: PD40 domain-containing protein [Phycisphaeraceae bacterium]|nr:PD40 domain-containing protein [Phycisphaeraceae bacterium]
MMRDTTTATLAGIVGTLVLVVAGALAWQFASTRGQVVTDGSRIRVAADDAPVREVLWEPADILPDWINDPGVPGDAGRGEENYEPRLTNDGNRLLFVRGRAGGGADLFGAERTRDGWGEPFPLASINTEDADELGPALTGDGRTLYFYSDRAGGQGGYDLWLVRRLDDPEASLRDAEWGEAQNLGPLVNSAYNDYAPAPSPDGATLYFASNRPLPEEQTHDPSDNWPATVREQIERRTYDLYAAPLTPRGHALAERLAALCTDANEGTPAVSPAGDFLYFASDRAGGAGGLDIYRARLRDGVAPRAEALGWPINTPANELDPALSMHGFALHFSSDRAPTPEHAETDGDSTGTDGATSAERPHAYAIYSTVSREVFRERDPVLAGFDWAAAWGAIWPWLLLLALLLLLLLLLRRFLRDEDLKRRWRTLSLLAKCLILSLLLHALLAALFTVWYVSGTLGGALRSAGGTRVALVSRSVGSDLASQIRGNLTEVSFEAQRTEAQRARPDVPSEARLVQASLEAQRVEAREARMDSTPIEMGESMPEAQAPRFTMREVEAAANEARELATPEASAGESAAESEYRPQSQRAPAAVSREAIAPSAGAAAATFETESVPLTDRPLATEAASSHGAAPAVEAARRSDVSLELAVRDATGQEVATPQAATAQAGGEAAMPTEPPGTSTPVPRGGADPTPSSGASRASIQVESVPTQDARLASREADGTSDAHTARVAVRAGGSASAVEIEPATSAPGVSTPIATEGRARAEESLAVRSVRAEVAQGTTQLPNSAASTSARSARLEPQQAMASEERSVAATERDAPAAPSERVVDGPRVAAGVDIPSGVATVATALPSASDSAAVPEEALAVRAAPSDGARTDRQSVDAPARTVAGSATLTPETVVQDAGATSLAIRSAQPIEPSSVPAMDAPSNAAVAVDLGQATPAISIDLPTASDAGTRGDEAEHPPAARTAAGESVARADVGPLAQLEVGVGGSAALMPERAPPQSDDRASLATSDDRAGEASTRSPIGPQTPPTPRLALDTQIAPITMPTLALPVFTEEPPAPDPGEALGTLAGVVRDEATGEPIQHARVRLDVTDGPPATARTDARGRYELVVPRGIPNNVAVSVAARGYTPASINVPADDIARAERRGRPLERDFELSPLDWAVVAIEDDPEVHHLGNDEFTGQINSQFQRSSEGLVWTREFSLAGGQIGAAIRAAELVLLAKGAQADNPIRINGRMVAGRIVDTPRDGSFGEMVFPFPTDWLREGANTIEIRSVRGSNDLDDFEFVNVRVRLRPTGLVEERLERAIK